MIGVRKALDFVFTQHELKILDDVMPDHAKKERHESKKDDDFVPGLLPIASSGSVAIPLANGNILKIPVEKFVPVEVDKTSINISEQLKMSGTWKNIDQQAKKDHSSKANGDKSCGSVAKKTSSC